MAGRRDYVCALGFTSQFYFCSLPLRLDPYSRCSFGCHYCFAAARGGDKRGHGLQVTDAEALKRRLDRISAGRVRTALDQLIERGQPLHIGGMSDPFVAAERREAATLRILRILADAGHPAIVSTKGVELIDDRYLEVLARGRFLVQISLSSMDERLMQAVDLRAPGPSRRIQAVRDLSEAGVPVSVRVQPLLPTREGDAVGVIEASAAAGASHASFEHLKLGLERWAGTETLSGLLGIEVAREFRRRRAERVGRKWILPLAERLPRQVELRERTHALGMSFAAADNDLLLLSDGGCCCSGADLIAGIGQYYRYNYLEAIRRGLETNRVSLRSLDDVWRPTATISSHVNSRSRIPATAGQGAGVAAYIRRNWAGRANGNSPSMFWGVEASGEVDGDGSAVYRVEDEALRLYRDRRAGPPTASERNNRIGLSS